MSIEKVVVTDDGDDTARWEFIPPAYWSSLPEVPGVVEFVCDVFRNIPICNSYDNVYV